MSRIRLAPLSVAVGLALASAGPVSAHHGWSDYGEQNFELTGLVQSATLGGAHGLLKVKAANGVWDVVLSPPRGIVRAGLTTAVLPRGTRVTARGHRHNDAGRLEMKTERLVVGRRTFDLYPDRP